MISTIHSTVPRRLFTGSVSIAPNELLQIAIFLPSLRTEAQPKQMALQTLTDTNADFQALLAECCLLEHFYHLRQLFSLSFSATVDFVKTRCLSSEISLALENGHMQFSRQLVILESMAYRTIQRFSLNVLLKQMCCFYVSVSRTSLKYIISCVFV